MDHDKNRNYIRIHKAFIIIILLLAAGIYGWYIGRNDDSPITITDDVVTLSNTDSDSDNDVESLISYDLPDGWQKTTCDSSTSIYIFPNTSNINCESTEISPIKISKDSSKTTDCNQLQNVSNVKKHICISLYINDMRSLKATTEYLANSSFGKETNIHSYYIDTGAGVAKLEYFYTSDNRYQITFDELANSVKRAN